MSCKIGSFSLLILITLLFTAGLVYATIELPGLINLWLIQTFDFPGVDSSLESSITDAFIQSHHLRLIGIGAFTAVVALIVVGLVAEKRRLASVGAFAFFLPVFGHFALNMFFLAGLGVLRVIWMPILDVSYSWLNLGDISYLPYMVLVYFPALIGLDVRSYVIYFFMAFGILLFLSSVFAWLYSRMRGRNMVDWGLYRFSRHPQYLGWIVWSYGMMLFISRMRGPRIMYSLGQSLPWLLSTMVIVCVAMQEEMTMDREAGYHDYRSRIPFLLPLPSSVSRVISWPQRLVLRKERPESGWEVFIVLLVYTGILVLLSLPFVLFHWPPDTGWFRFPFNAPPFL